MGGLLSCYFFSSSVVIALISSSDSGSTFDLYRPMISPFRPTRNFSKFHFTSSPPNLGFVSFEVRLFSSSTTLPLYFDRSTSLPSIPVILKSSGPVTFFSPLGASAAADTAAVRATATAAANSVFIGVLLLGRRVRGPRHCRRVFRTGQAY